MAGVHDKKKHSYDMWRIKATNAKPEWLVWKFLHAQGFRYKLHDKTLPAKPDIELPKYKAVIFIHGCFWHGHINCKYYVVPKTRTDWWVNKINVNNVNDVRGVKTLRKEGWKIIPVWECQLKTAKAEKTLEKILLRLLC